MGNAECGYTYNGAKEHHILNIDRADEAIKVTETLLPALDNPKKKVSKKKNKGCKKR